MKLQKKYTLLITLITVIVLAGGLALLRDRHQSSITRYEAADGWVYQCSKPIKAKNGTAQTLGHPQGFIPYSQSEADKYCYKVGIE